MILYRRTEEEAESIVIFEQLPLKVWAIAMLH